MIPEIRSYYNQKFSDATYKTYLEWINRQHFHKPVFRISESPVFVPRGLKEKLFEACEDIMDTIVRPDFKQLSEAAIPPGQSVPEETEHTTFLQMDFGICLDENGEFVPQLIEAQGFPSLYFFQDLLARAFKKHFYIPEGYSHLFHGYDSEAYIEKLRDIIVGDTDPKNVILLEVEPNKQTTLIDFIVAAETLRIKTCCVGDLHVSPGGDVFYESSTGKMVQIEKIFNRVIFDELVKRDDLKREFHFADHHNVEWVGHPNWFFRISKHTLPYLKSKYVPESVFLNDLEKIPDDLSQYVLKPLYSFAGSGVIINLNRYDIDAIKGPENYILQKKIEYAPVIATPSGPAKCEIRMLMVWEKGAARPQIINNLVRLSKGEMVGVRYNKDKDWVGASVGFFPE